MPRPKKIKMPSISFIVARSYPENIIGCDNELPWHLKSDLKRFRKITSGHSIIMGSNTFYSIGKVLPDRENIVISRKKHNILQKDLYWTRNKETAVLIADIFSISNRRNEIFVIGGQKMYELFNRMFNKIHLTEVFDKGLVDGDAFFNYKFDRRIWKTLDETDVPASDDDEFPSRYTVYESREKKNRIKWSSEFLTDSERVRDFIEKYKTEHPEHKSDVDAVMHQQYFPEFIVEDEC